ncbi:MAG: hypothetical protein AAFU73_23645, partial [Planctomycetota bacterium]
MLRASRQCDIDHGAIRGAASKRCERARKPECGAPIRIRSHFENTIGAGDCHVRGRESVSNGVHEFEPPFDDLPAKVDRPESRVVRRSAHVDRDPVQLEDGPTAAFQDDGAIRGACRNAVDREPCWQRAKVELTPDATGAHDDRQLGRRNSLVEEYVPRKSAAPHEYEFEVSVARLDVRAHLAPETWVERSDAEGSERALADEGERAVLPRFRVEPRRPERRAPPGRLAPHVSARHGFADV